MKLWQRTLTLSHPTLWDIRLVILNSRPLGRMPPLEAPPTPFLLPILLVDVPGPRFQGLVRREADGAARVVMTNTSRQLIRSVLHLDLDSHVMRDGALLQPIVPFKIRGVASRTVALDVRLCAFDRRTRSRRRAHTQLLERVEDVREGI